MKRSYLVTERDIRRFSQAIGAPEPRKAADGRLIAEPLFCQVFMFEDVPVSELASDGSPKEINVDIPAKRTVGGGSDFEIFGPVFSGDTLTVHSKLKGVTEKSGKSGTLFLVQVETEFTNQQGQQIARETATYVKRD
ncbi:MAG: MaoC family dehydratase N-terminal domain-containing protein [Bdellovibrionales bacterium]|nr:MaoC family dehydratase N-terminal domain-containing protein [Bdellovibrionales bacterium]